MPPYSANSRQNKALLVGGGGGGAELGGDYNL